MTQFDTFDNTGHAIQKITMMFISLKGIAIFFNPNRTIEIESLKWQFGFAEVKVCAVYNGAISHIQKRYLK